MTETHAHHGYLHRKDDVLAREKKAFTSLLGTPESVARVKHMLATGTPLRN